MKSTVLWFALLGMANAHASARDVSATVPVLISSFEYYDKKLPGPPDGWIGLAKTPRGYELKTYQLKINKTKKRGIEDYPLYRTSTVPNDTVLFLTRGLGALTPGPVVAAQPLTADIPVWEKRQIAMVLGLARYRLSTGCSERPRRAHDIQRVTNKYYSCALRIEGADRALLSLDNPHGESGSDGEWRPYLGIEKLLWAGDLDRDGKLDFLLQEVSKSESIDTLYLSSIARKKDIARQAVAVKYVWD